MTYKEWLTTEAGMRWETAIKSFVPDYSDLKAVVHITQDVFHASKNAVEAEMRIDDKVAAERARCADVVREMLKWPYELDETTIPTIAKWLIREIEK